jgi:hypothetical protein
MTEVTFSYPTPEGTREIRIDAERTTFGRGSEASHRFADDGLSRLHASVYRDGDRVWIVDENSSNGTFVNGSRVPDTGTPLGAGDTIRIGHRTELTVRITESRPFMEPPPTMAAAPPDAVPAGVSILPIALMAGAILIVSLSVAFVGITVFGGGAKTEVASESNDDLPLEPRPRRASDPAPFPANEKPAADAPPVEETPTSGPALPGPAAPPRTDVLRGRQYMQLSDAEKRQYLSEQARTIAQVIGNSSSDPIPPAALDKIKSFTEGYVSRLNAKGMDGCPSRRPWGDNLHATYERASKNAPFINKAFAEKGVDQRIGLYLAMIESEHCVCLQSEKGPLGMFQFARATAEAHGLRAVKGASPDNPDERCEPEPAARAAASYMKALTARFGVGAASIPLAIGSYNSGENGLNNNLEKALRSADGLPRDFWTLIANGEKLSDQFQSENFKYVPKFFAAAIIGENPKDFGLRIHPLSTYSK